MRFTNTQYDIDKGPRKRLRSGVTGMLAAIIIAPGIVSAFGNIFEKDNTGVTDPIVTEIVDSAVSGGSGNKTDEKTSVNENSSDSSLSAPGVSSTSPTGTARNVDSEGSTNSNTSPGGSSYTTSSSPALTGGMGGDPASETSTGGTAGNDTDTSSSSGGGNDSTSDEPSDPLDILPLDTVNEIGGAVGLPVIIDKSLRLRRKK